MRDVLVIVNPRSNGGRTGRGWRTTAAHLEAAGLRFDVAMTSRPGDATYHARRAVREGRPVVVAAVGDGTINEVANGFFEGGEPGAGATGLGVLPMGTGGDFRRTLRIPTDPAAAAAVLEAGRVRRIDVGRVRCALPGGGQAVRHFVNVADAGIGGDVVRRVNQGHRLVNGEVTFLLASVTTLLRWRNKPMRIDVDGRVRELVAQQVVVANCQYFGGGMRVAPGAAPDDGLLDVIVAGDLGPVENLRGLGRIRRGTHLDEPHPKLSHTQAVRVEISSPEIVLVDVDGEQPGTLPATFEVVPGALRVIVP
jgi:YegS/Rv2252/BmrU family lipid kinase